MRWNGRAVLLPALLLVGLLITLRLDRGGLDEAAPVKSPTVLDAPSLTMTLTRGQLSIVGTTRSIAHEELIARVATDRYRNIDIHTDFQPGILIPKEWEPVSVRLLYVLAAMESADAIMRDDSISLRGVAASTSGFEARLAFLREAMTADSTLFDDVILVDYELQFDELCERSFAALGSLPVAFAESSAALKESSYPSLDKLVHFAWDCPHTGILITGHTDASGAEAWNMQLSRARAQAVADYLNANGVGRERLVVEGRGSSEPIADNGTRYGRSLNRRIEFALRAPLL